MKNTPRLHKIWFGSIIYLLLLFVAFNSVLAEIHFPGWIELLFKGTAFLAFIMVLGWPVLCLLINASTRFRTLKRSKSFLAKATLIAAYLSIAGYALLAAELLYIKLKVCDPSGAVDNAQWYCKVEGVGIMAEFVLVPVLAASIGLFVAAVKTK